MKDERFNNCFVFIKSEIERTYCLKFKELIDNCDGSVTIVFKTNLDLDPYHNYLLKATLLADCDDVEKLKRTVVEILKEDWLNLVFD